MDKDLTKKLAAGGFFIAGLVLILIFVFTIGKNKGFAQPKFQVTVLFKNVGGLSEGAPVRLSGVNVGNVSTIGFLNKDIKGRIVRVTLNIYRKYRAQLEKDVQFVIKTEGILGEKIVEINVLSQEKVTDLTQLIIGQEPLDVQDLAIVFADAAQSFTKTTQELSKIDIVQFTQVAEESARTLSITSRSLNDVMLELKEISKKSKRLLDRVEEKLIDGTLLKIF